MLARRAAHSRAKASSVAATVTAVGRRLATSPAKVGPERTPRGTSEGSSSAATSWRRRPLDGSSPLVAHSSPEPPAGIAASSATSSLNAWLGTATRHAPAGPTTLESTGSTSRPSGKRWPGRYFSLLPSRAMAANPASSRPHSATAWPLRASRIASAVPHEPAPSTATSHRRFMAPHARRFHRFPAADTDLINPTLAAQAFYAFAALNAA